MKLRGCFAHWDWPSLTVTSLPTWESAHRQEVEGQEVVCTLMREYTLMHNNKETLNVVKENIMYCKTEIELQNRSGFDSI